MICLDCSTDADREVSVTQACLEHRHSFVRRNAVLAINALYKLPKGEQLLQDAPELIEKVLQVGATGQQDGCDETRQWFR